MPELNGIQLLSCVKQDANLRAVPVVSECLPPLGTVCKPPVAATSLILLHLSNDSLLWKCQGLADVFSGKLATLPPPPGAAPRAWRVCEIRAKRPAAWVPA